MVRHTRAARAARAFRLATDRTENGLHRALVSPAPAGAAALAAVWFLATDQPLDGAAALLTAAGLAGTWSTKFLPHETDHARHCPACSRTRRSTAPEGNLMFRVIRSSTYAALLADRAALAQARAECIAAREALGQARVEIDTANDSAIRTEDTAEALATQLRQAQQTATEEREELHAAIRTANAERDQALIGTRVCGACGTRRPEADFNHGLICTRCPAMSANR